MEKKLIQEAEDQLKRTLLMMKYDASKTLDENYNIVLKEQSNPKTEQAIKNAILFAHPVEVQKYQKLISKGDPTKIWCKPCSFTVTGTLKGDVDEQTFCVNQSVYNNKWECPEGYNIMSVLTKEYGYDGVTYDKSKIDEIYNMVKSLPTYKYVDPIFGGWNREKVHTMLAISQMVLPFFGPPGMLISLGVSAVDAGMYYQEEKYFEAGLSLLFGFIDAGFLLHEVKLMKLSTKEADNIVKAVKYNKVGKLTERETKALNVIIENKNQITKEELARKVMERARKTGDEKVIKDVAKILTNEKTGLKYGLKQLGTYGAGYMGAKEMEGKIKENSPKSVVERTKCGDRPCDWEKTKEIFGSDGSVNDNLLLKTAIESGWIPYGVEGKDELPEKFQTETYKKKWENLADEILKIKSTDYDSPEIKKEFSNALEKIFSEKRKKKKERTVVSF